MLLGWKWISPWKNEKKKSGVSNDEENAIEKKLTRQSIYKSTINLMAKDVFVASGEKKKTFSQTNKGLRLFTMTMSIYPLVKRHVSTNLTSQNHSECIIDVVTKTFF